MVSFEDMKSCIQEWYSDHFHDGVCGIAKVYATITGEAERQLEYFGKYFKDTESVEPCDDD